MRFTGIRISKGGTSDFTPSRVDDVALQINLLSQQTGNALEVNNSSGTNLAKVDKSGNLTAVNGVFSGTLTGGLLPIIDATGDTTVLTAAQSGSLVLMGKTSGSVITLPAPQVGLWYNFVITVSNTTNSNEIKTDAGTTFLLGSVLHSATGIAPLAFWANGTNIVALKMDGAHLGGLIGSEFYLQCISTTQWSIAGTNLGTATMTTAFNTTA